MMRVNKIIGTLTNCIFNLVGRLFGWMVMPFKYRFDICIEKMQVAFATSYWTGKLYRSHRISIYPNVRFYRPKMITLGEGTVLHRHVLMEVCNTDSSDKRPKIIIGKNCHIGDYSHFSAFNMIKIGDGLLTGRYVLITDNSHGENLGVERNIPPHMRKIISKGPVVIGKNVWLGDCVAIMANVTIGDGAIVAAHSVVTHDVPPFTLVAGVPARIIKETANTLSK